MNILGGRVWNEDGSGVGKGYGGEKEYMVGSREVEGKRFRILVFDDKREDDKDGDGEKVVVIYRVLVFEVSDFDLFLYE